MAFLCCLASRSHSPTLVPPDSERLRTLQPASFVSLALPPDTVPHRPTTGIDEHQALRDIFGVSPSSHRGYQAAANSSGSFDTTFRFGHGSLAKSRTRAQRSLDKLGHNICQRLSQSRLSTHSSRKSMKDVRSTETVIHTTLLPNSQISTGLDDLLVSRNVSEGGYDSDARGIQTPPWPKPSAGSVLVSPEYTAKVLDAFDMSPSKRSASLPRTPCSHGAKGQSPANVSCTPTTDSRRYAAIEAVKHVQEPDGQVRFRAVSTPQKSGTPQRNSFSALLQLRSQESPTDVLRRLSVGLASGTIKLPDTPELKAMRMPSIAETMPEWKLSFAAPKRASSLHRGDHEVRQPLKTLSDRVEKAKRDSAASDWTSSKKHVSLLSNLDPALLQYVSKYGDDEQLDHLHKPLADVKDSDENGEAFRNSPDVDTISHVDTSGLRDSTNAEPSCVEYRTNGTSSEEYREGFSAGLESEKESVHLFDMRISQRLASTSVLPTLSPSSTNLGSNEQYTDRSSQSLGKLDRFPTFIGQTSAEHLRKPSDPRTRRLLSLMAQLMAQLMEESYIPSGRPRRLSAIRILESPPKEPKLAETMQARSTRVILGIRIVISRALLLNYLNRNHIRIRIHSRLLDGKMH